MRVAIATGGTGGHIFPALALAEVLRARGAAVTFLIDARAERTHGAAMPGAVVIAGAGLSGRGARAVAAAGGVARGIAQAWRALRRVGAQVLVAFGGYMSVAPVLAARALRLRVVLHEQNAVMGRANRVLARLASAVALSFADTRAAPPGAMVTGNPVRACEGALYAQPGGGTRVLVLGGSLGAAAFAALPDMIVASGCAVTVAQQCRAGDVDAVRAAYAQGGIEAEIATFFGDVARRMQGAHLVISRAGASSVAEIAVAGRPSVLVPLPGAIDDHQTANARVLADAGAAVVVAQPAMATIGDVLRDLLCDPARLSAMAAACERVARPDAADRLADLVLAP